jgi:hypothetical protein
MPLVVIAMTALLALGALVLDVGNVYASKEQAQGSADNAALAKAVECAGASPTVDPPELFMAAGVTPVSSECTFDTVLGNTATVKTEKPVEFGLARAVGLAGTTVKAEAVASYQRFSKGTAVPLAISACDFSSEVIVLHGSSTCNRGPSGADLAGGFGWLTGTNCIATRNADGTYSADTGRPDKTKCDWKKFVDDKTPIQLLIFNGYDGHDYKVAGFVTLVLTGYSFQSKSYGTLSGGCPGGKEEDCITVTFLEGDIENGDPISGPCNPYPDSDFDCRVYLVK